MSKIQGTVKWFSNKKGFGFITPGEGSPTVDDIFVHQSSILSEGYRTLDEGWSVEFTIGQDNGNRMKAENVTGVGGGPCTGPPRQRRRKPKHDSSGNDTPAEEEKVRSGRRGPRGRSNREPRDTSSFWHNDLDQDVKDALAAKEIRVTSGTIDVSLDDTRIKLGTGGYASMANAEGILAEGTFTFESNGTAKVSIGKVISFVDNEWQLKPHEDCSLPVSFSLTDAALGNVKADETAVSLWGEKPLDPRNALEENGFLMRRVVLTPKGGR